MTALPDTATLSGSPATPLTVPTPVNITLAAAIAAAQGYQTSAQTAQIAAAANAANANTAAVNASTSAAAAAASAVLAAASVAGVQSFNGRAGVVTLSSSDVTGVLGFTPLNPTTAAATYAPIASPALTGTPTAPTATGGTNTTQLATTAFVAAAVSPLLTASTASATYAPLASPALTGAPTAPTAGAGTNTTQLATTAFVAAALLAAPKGGWDVVVEDQKTSGTAGGSASAGTNTRTLNTLVQNNNSWGSLASNVVTLAAGTWEIEWDAPAVNPGAHKCSLYNSTGSTLIAAGASEYAFTTQVQTKSGGRTQVTIGSPTGYTLVHYCGQAQATNGLGQPTSQSSVVEVYARFRARKIA